MLTMLARFLKALNSEAGPWAIAWAFVLGMIMGLTPLISLHNLIILFLALSLRINFAGFLLAFLFFSGLAYLFDPIADYIGESLLQAEALAPLWYSLYEMPVARLFQFNHTITLGSLVFALLISPLWLYASYYLVVNYRTRVKAWFVKLKIVQGLKGSKFYGIYQRVDGFRRGTSL
ncbi:TIGR03546 family protein [Aliidiomarina minuta]|uniref:TIGR03546 family protein n=1 Tax=Aliidiomarina minuta TaxID=880057 RepID=UPI0018E5183D|nr:TIGR03546 family protein [Aliidiomarina minuta]